MSAAARTRSRDSPEISRSTVFPLPVPPKMEDWLAPPKTSGMGLMALVRS
jgi:hypothetical protein